MEYKKLTLVVESKIYNPSKELEDYCSFYSFLHRKMFNILRNNVDTLDRNQLQREFSAEHQIQVRVFRSIFIKTLGEILRIKTLDKTHIKELQCKIKSLETKAHTTNKDKRHKNKCKINKLDIKINKIKNKKIVNICFGGKRFYKKQWNAPHDSWLTDWKRKRNNYLYFIGAECESFGNSLAQLQTLNSLRLTLPKSFENKYLNLDVDFNHDSKPYKLLQYARENNRPLTYNILQKDNENWYVQVCFSLDVPIVESVCGNIGIDLNYNMIATSETDFKGNFIGFKQYKFETENKSSEQITQILSDIAGKIVHQAKRNNKNIVIEDLNLNKTENKGQIVNRKLHMVLYSKFFMLLKNKALKQQILVKEVNPAFTSIIGKYKYMKALGINIHSAASFVIARRGFSNIKTVEKIPFQILHQLHSGESDVVSWKAWSQLNKSIAKSFPELFKGISFKRQLPFKEHTTDMDNPPPLIRSGVVPLKLLIVCGL